MHKLDPAVGERIIGRINGESDGPLVLAIGGMHGNEPSGVEALNQVIKYLEDQNIPFRGDFVAFSGNIEALRSGQRFIHRDLNRIWILDNGSKQLADLPDSSETRELRELYALLKLEVEQRRGPMIMLDLHTTSVESPPFLIVPDTLASRNFVRDLPSPLILGLEEQIEGPLLSYANEFGHICIGFEAGQHDDPQSKANHISMLWIILVKAGCLRVEEVPDFKSHLLSLKDQTRAYNKVYEVLHRKGIVEGDDFEMRPGYTNFQPIRKGELLARHHGKNVQSPSNGYIFMPLYQVLGDDGFFVISKVAAFWIWLSFILRKTNAKRILPFLPGVNKHPNLADTFVVNKKIAQFFVLQIFHLLGYRRKSESGNHLIVKQRMENQNLFDKS